MASPTSSISITSTTRSFRNLASPRNLNSPRMIMSPRFLASNTPSPTASTGRRASIGQYVAMPREDDDPAGEVSSKIKYLVQMPATPANYTVQIPPTPDLALRNSVDGNGTNNTASVVVDPAVAAKAEQQFVSNTIFTGGFNSLTRGHVLDKMIESEAAHPQMACARGNACAIYGCDGKAMRDERGEDVLPCECAFKICRDCYFDAINNGGKCPGCKETFKILDPDGPNAETLPLPAPKPDRRILSRKYSEFDHTRWLYETKGTYGYGNAVWPKDDAYLGAGGPPSFKEKSCRPFSRKTKISAAILSPYRLLVLVRLAALVLFLMWRIKHPNRKAMWLWGLSVICELWFAFSWILDQLPKLCPCNRMTDLNVLKERFETRSPENPLGKSDLPGVDVFVSTADPEKEPPLVTANTILSILAAEYPVDKLCCYLSDDGGALLSFEALAEAASFARIWVPFCRKHNIEPRNPETYFLLKGDPTKNKVKADFVKDRRRVKREYDEFKVRINGLADSIRRRSDAYNAHEDIRAKRAQLESGGDPLEILKVPKATWMADGTHWPGTWTATDKEHGRGDHAGIIQVMLAPPSPDPLMGSADEENLIDTTDVDIRLPMLVYVSREKRAGYDHNKKAGAMNALVRTSAIMSNGPFILNLDCDHYVYNANALREAMCFLMGRGGDSIAYVQFPQRFEGIDPNDRYANRNTVFFDVNMRALDGIQGPVYVGTGCVFRRIALYGFDPPWIRTRSCFGKSRKRKHEEEDDLECQLLPKRFGNSVSFGNSIPVAEFEGRPLQGVGVKLGRPPGALTAPREPLDAGTVAEAINVISCYYEDKTEWGQRIGWIYGSVTEDVVTGFRMHNRGWKSVYCVTKRDAFRGTAPINLTDRLHQVLRWATGSVEIFFSRNNALFASSRLKFLQRIAYLNVAIYPFTSIFLLIYCFLPALSLFTGQFIVQQLNVAFLVYLLVITVTLCLLAILEIRWSGITLDEWWRNEQFWVIGGTSAHLAAVFQGLLKVIAGLDISFTLTSKSGSEDEDDVFADLYVVKWSALMILPITIMMVNLVAIAVGVSRTLYSEVPQWSKLLGGVFFSLWVLFHLYPFAKGLMGRRRRTPTIIFVWSGLLSIVISLLWVSLSSTPAESGIGGRFQFP